MFISLSPLTLTLLDSIQKKRLSDWSKERYLDVTYLFFLFDCFRSQELCSCVTLSRPLSPLHALSSLPRIPLVHFLAILYFLIIIRHYFVDFFHLIDEVCLPLFSSSRLSNVTLIILLECLTVCHRTR